MISKSDCKNIIDMAIEHARGRVDGVEVIVTGSEVATSRFANNGMTQNQAPSNVSFSVRVISKGRQARLLGDDFSPKGVRQVVDNAVTAVGFVAKDEGLLPIPDQAASKPPEQAYVSRFDAATARLSPKERADEVREMIEVAKNHKLTAAGVYATGATVTALGNSNGTFLHHDESCAECSITMVGENSTGWAKAHGVTAGSVDTRALAVEAANKALSSKDPKEIQPGHYTVILPPSAVLDLLSYLWVNFTGTSHVDKQSCLLDKVDKRVFGENITITDDVSHPLQAGTVFDGEGLPRSVVTLVDRGVVKGLVFGRRSAHEMRVEPTGHGVAQPSREGEVPMNLVLKGGDSSLEQMVRTTDRGILLSRVWYVRLVDPATVLITGMTRDGTFLIEDGEIKHGIKNLRFNISVIDLLNNVLELGPSVRAAGEESIPQVVPAMKVANFNFTSTTKF